MPTCKKAETVAELQGILQLQRQNLPQSLSEAEKASEGFVTVVHSPDTLAQLNSIEPHIVAVEGESVVAYVLAMTAASAQIIPLLQPMFSLFHEIQFAGRPVASFRYLVVGQVCVDKAFRGSGLLQACYAFYRQTFHNKYDFAITEIAADNLRSLQAHQRIGFAEVHRFVAPDAKEWVIVLWDWNGLSG